MKARIEGICLEINRLELVLSEGCYFFGSRKPSAPADRPDQPSLLNGAKNEGWREKAKGEVGPLLAGKYKSYGSARQPNRNLPEHSVKRRLPRRSSTERRRAGIADQQFRFKARLGTPAYIGIKTYVTPISSEIGVFAFCLTQCNVQRDATGSGSATR